MFLKRTRYCIFLLFSLVFSAAYSASFFFILNVGTDRAPFSCTPLVFFVEGGECNPLDSMRKKGYSWILDTDLAPYMLFLSIVAFFDIFCFYARVRYCVCVFLVFYASVIF